MNKISRNKISTINRLSLNVLRLEESKGHLKWKVQELGERLKVLAGRHEDEAVRKIYAMLSMRIEKVLNK